MNAADYQQQAARTLEDILQDVVTWGRATFPHGSVQGMARQAEDSRGEES